MTDRLTLTDCRQAGFCVRGIRDQCKAHDINFREFLAEGLDLDYAKTLKDVNVQRCVAIAEERILEDGRRR